MSNPMVKYGVYGGVLMLILTFLFYFIDYTMLASMWIGIGIIVIYLIFAVIAVRKQKSLNQGLIDFKNAFITSIGALAISNLIATIGMILLFNVVQPDLKDKISEQIVENTIGMMKSMNAPAEAIDEQLEEFKELPNNYTPGGQIKGYFSMLIFFAIVSLIIAAIMKSKRHELEEAQATD